MQTLALDAVVCVGEWVMGLINRGEGEAEARGMKEGTHDTLRSTGVVQPLSHHLTLYACVAVVGVIGTDLASDLLHV